MRRISRISVIAALAALVLFILHVANPASRAQNASFHNAPPSAKTTKNPYEGQQPDAAKSVYQSRCAACHGPNGEGVAPQGTQLVGGVGTLASENPIRTVGSYWPYATSVWDYIHRAMPQNQPGSLSADETYAVTAFLLNRNKIIEANEVMDKESLPKVRMPNRDGFIPDARPDVGKNGPPAEGSKNQKPPAR